jgi:UDP-glucose 4-epimerase
MSVHFVGTLTLLEAMRDNGVGKIVFSSSFATYGSPGVLPVREETPQQPINPYGASKAIAERVLADFGAAHALMATVLRYFNAAGADPERKLLTRLNGRHDRAGCDW